LNEIGLFKSTIPKGCDILTNEVILSKSKNVQEGGLEMKDIFSNIAQQIDNIDAKI